MEKLIKALKQHTEALTAFTYAVMELVSVVGDCDGVESDDNDVHSTYLDGSSL